MEDTPNESSFWERLKESPRTVSALIIILIVAAAIYAFSGEKATPEERGEVEEQTAVTEEVIPAEEQDESQKEETEQVAGEVSETQQQEGERETTEQEKQGIAKAERTGQGYVEIAQAGDGYTHLARRATSRWLSENQPGFEVTDEHRIYIEDYIQNRMGTEGLELGSSHTIPFDLITEAVDAASQLNEQQLNNLSQYTAVLN